ncbi:hypothetical protein F4813DRAFT_359630 [Daldinia decipiens]|uniref:uncharacterized protein n=1 Tax=Daldinia decipiens TaxID=326647 RepID=UPI0020C4AE4E|nr:uncharacterized protein F4813DRAFT_359630 [Daldinia decipiens]KAI1657799.1 hypothetical protein F4813DRAFT_359630 [Daldinia decipiens]
MSVPVPVRDKSQTPVSVTGGSPMEETLTNIDIGDSKELLQKLRRHISWITEWVAKNKPLCNSNNEDESTGEVSGKTELDGGHSIQPPIPAKTEWHTSSSYDYRGTNERGEILSHDTADEAKDNLGDEAKEPNTAPHRLVDAHEAAAKSLGYGRIPYEYLVNPEGYRNQYFEVKKSRLGGYGAFAKTDLRQGQLILAERPILTASPVTLYQDLELLAPELRAAFYRMHGHKRSPDHDKRQAIFLTNAFAVHESSLFYFIAARFNHACGQVSSVKYRIARNNIIELRMGKDVPASTELTISYGPMSPSSLYTLWGFRCACGGCRPLTDAEVKRLDRRDDDAYGIW